LTFEEYPYKGKKVYVFTHNAKQQKKKNKTTSDVEYVDKDIPEFVLRLIQQPFSNRDIWLLGGGEILSLLLNAELVDEIILSVHPIILGKGVPLFKNIKKSVKLRLLESIPFESELVQLRYCILN
jgi:dihydrofolate reductase